MIKIINCDLFEADVDVICHQVNCQGVMGSGVAKQVKARYPKAFEEYKKWCDALPLNTSPLLGNNCSVLTEGKWIINMFAQDKFGYDGKCYTNLDSLKMCLEDVYKSFKSKRIAFPYLMSCDRGGADWKVVESMIIDILGDCDVTICRKK